MSERSIRRLVYGTACLALLVLPLAPSSHASASGLAKRHRPAPRDPGQTVSVFGTSLLSGSMQSNVTITMTGGFSVGQMTNLDWDLPLAKSISVGGYSEQVTGVSFKFNEAPNSTQDIANSTNPAIMPVRRFHWDAPQANTPIRLSETLHLAVNANLQSFSSSARYPLGSISADAQPFLKATVPLQLPASANSLVSRLRSSGSTEEQVVQAVQNWVASNTVYQSAPNQPFSAAWVFNNHRGNCQGFDDLMSGLLRKLGIPARTIFGWVAADKIRLPGPRHSFSSLNWSVAGTPGELHTWLQAWFPDVGWVSFDPQEEKFFSDVRHLAFFISQDAQTPRGYAAFAFSPAGGNNYGRPFPNGSTIFAPGDGVGSKVTVHNQDHFSMGFRRQMHDVSSLIMFAR